MFASIAVSAGLFVVLMLGQECGRVLRRRDGADSGGGGGAAEGVVLAVLGLLIAFTFTASASRFDTRRALIVEQANALSTAWQRLDLLPAEDRLYIRVLMQQWTAMAVRAAREAARSERDSEFLVETQQLQADVWRSAVESLDRLGKPTYTAMVLSPINEWSDLTTTRLAQNQMGLPPMVLPTLIVLAVVSSVLAGAGMMRGATRRLVLMVAFAGAVSFAIYVILDLNHPRAGLISVKGADEVMIRLNQSFEQQLTTPERR